jgi:hypothetical protein
VGIALLLLAGTPSQELRPGLVGEFWSVGHELADFPTLAFDHRPVTRRIDRRLEWETREGPFADTDLVDFFYARWTGVLRVPKAETYTFTLESDDGSRLWIGDKLTLDHGGCHMPIPKKASIRLEAGDHELKIEFFENAGGAGLKVWWEAPGLEREILPARALLHRKDKDLDGE